MHIPKKPKTYIMKSNWLLQLVKVEEISRRRGP